MRRRDHNIFANATSLLICGLLAGVVVAAAAFPAVAMSGLAAKAGGQTFAQLPSELKDFSSPQITRIFASDNKTQIAVMYDEFRSDVPLKDISKNMQNAIIAAEDREFYHHNGVDLKGVARAFVNNNQGGGKQGASTLTMQYVRMSLAYSATNPQEVVDATKDTPKRKITEMKYALQVEKELTKQQILERYLNVAPFGNQAYGVYAASQVYFNKKPKDLSVAEAALLAGMVKAPTSYNPATASGYPQAVQRRAYVIDSMVKTGAITPADAANALKVKVPKKVKLVGNGCVNVAKNNWGFYCDYFYRWWLSQEAFGATTYDRERRLKSGGYRVVTSMDKDAQADARKRVSQHISDSNKDALLLAAVEPGTGRVRALAANRKFKLDDPAHPQNKMSSDPRKAAQGIRGTYPNTTNPLLTGGGDITGYQAGSVFKIFTMVAALEKGYPLGYTIKAEDVYKSHYIIDPSSPAACPGTHFYCPQNAAKEAGVYNLWTGFGKSVNTFFVPLEERVGAANVVDVAKRFGVQFRSSNDAGYANDPASANQWGAFTNFEVYNKKYPILDCRSTPATARSAADERCYQGYLYFNGYISERFINSHNANGMRNGVFGLPADYRAAQSPVNPWPKGGQTTDANATLYDTNNVNLKLKDGSTVQVGVDTGLHPWRQQYRLGPFNWTTGTSLLKDFALRERLRLRTSFDLFNVLNVQGLNTPGADGIVTLQNSYGGFGIRPRQVQVKARLEW